MLKRTLSFLLCLIMVLGFAAPSVKHKKFKILSYFNYTFFRILCQSKNELFSLSFHLFGALAYFFLKNCIKPINTAKIGVEILERKSLLWKKTKTQ